jgi:mannose/cellobiose epimerase-like protein (N-acyl-D-glucosamine 2-epimerase family)
MHMCEALIAAYEATSNRTYLDRAEMLAQTFAVKLAAKAGGFVWEHYTKDWDVDWTYNVNDPSNIYRPWGFQPGHQMEWSKNLLNLNRHAPEAWKVKRAEELFNSAWEISWDSKYGGLVYGFAPNRTWDTLGDWAQGKYFWVQAETFATAALLYNATRSPSYVERYVDLWHYVWDHWVDHEYGAWYGFNLTRSNQLINDQKAIAGAKCDYHPFMACISALVAFP